MTTRKTATLSATCTKADEVEHLEAFARALPADSYLKALLSDDMLAFVSQEIYNDHTPDAYALICDLRRALTEQLQANATIEQALRASSDAHRREVEALNVDMREARELHLSIEQSLKAEHEATLLRVHAARDVDTQQVREEYDSLIEREYMTIDAHERELQVVRGEYWRMTCEVDNMRLQLEQSQAQVVALKCKLFDLQNPDLA